MSRFISRIFYSGETPSPTLRFSDDEELMPLGKILSLSFDLSERYCIGWHDMTTGDNHACPEQSRIDRKFEVCPACQRRTGFNPAFYHTTKLSPQQEARNAEPHRLYLAYIGKEYIKVGISWDNRGIQRLLDQGARAGLVLETFPTALIARQYEEKIAKLSGIHETTTSRIKLALLNTPYSDAVAKEELLTAKQRIEDTLSVTFSGSEVLLFDTVYTQGTLSGADITPLPDPKISGKVEALVGDILVTRYDDRRLALPLKQFIGYPVDVTNDITPLDLHPQQMQLF